VGGEINTCYNALDIHIDQGRGDQYALIYDSPVTNTIKKYTYSELREMRLLETPSGQSVNRGARCRENTRETICSRP